MPPKETRIPGEAAPAAAADANPAAEQAQAPAQQPPVTAAEQMEAEVERRVQARLDAELDARVRQEVDTRLHNAKRDAQAASRPVNIRENTSLPSIKSKTEAELLALKRPTEFREGWYTPPGWPPNPETVRAEAIANANAQALAASVSAAVEAALNARADR